MDSSAILFGVLLGFGEWMEVELARFPPLVECRRLECWHQNMRRLYEEKHPFESRHDVVYARYFSSQYHYRAENRYGWVASLRDQAAAYRKHAGLDYPDRLRQIIRGFEDLRWFLGERYDSGRIGDQ